MKRVIYALLALCLTGCQGQAAKELTSVAMKAFCEAMVSHPATLEKLGRLSKAVRQGKLTVLAIYTEGDEEVWQAALPTMPAGWLVGTDRSVVKEKALYDLKAMPCLYLLDKQKRVLVKDGEYEEIMNNEL